MGNTVPSESNGATCYICSKTLPPCKSCDDYSLEYIDRLSDRKYVYSFNRGQYYRIQGEDNKHQCPDCFWKPKKDYIQKQEEERRKEEQRRIEEKRLKEEKEKKEEEERLQREKEQREKEKQKQEELKRREEEARKENERQEALRREEEERAERRREQQRLAEERKKRAQLNFEDQFSKEKGQGKRFFAWDLNSKRERVRQTVRIQPYRPPLSTDTHTREGNFAEDPESDYESLSESESDRFSSEVSGDLSMYDDGALFEHVYATVSNIKPTAEYIDIEWLQNIQMFLLCCYAKRYSFSLVEEQFLFDLLACIRANLSNQEVLFLTKTICELYFSHESDVDFHVPSTFNTSAGKCISKMLYFGHQLDYARP